MCVPSSPCNPALQKVPIGREKPNQVSVITYTSRQQHFSGGTQQSFETGSDSPMLRQVQNAAVSTAGKKVLREHGVTVLSNNSVGGFPLQHGAQFRRP